MKKNARLEAMIDKGWRPKETEFLDTYNQRVRDVAPSILSSVTAQTNTLICVIYGQ